MMNFVLSLLFASLALGLFARKLDWRVYLGFGLWTLGAALFYYVRH
jgi:hypothetical protein